MLRSETLLICIVGLFVCGLAMPAQVRGDENAISFEGRRVIDVLQDYQTRGFAFLYSSGVVRASLRFSQEPPGFNPVRRLRHALNSMDLALEHVSEREYRIVRAVVLPSNEEDITGRVTDAESGKPIAGARVVIGDLAAVTDQRGEFRLIAPTQNTQALHFTHPDYEAQHHTHGPEQRSFEVAMAPAIGLEELVVVSSRYAIHDRRTYAQSIDLELLESVPRLGEDPIRIANHLPGMATIGVSAKPHIRGGAQDELLVMFNNLELLEPFHLRDFKSVFSTFNPNVIQSIDIYTGGFPARYGDRLSGVMDISPGTSDVSKRGEVSLSLLNLGAWVQGQGERTDWVLSARRGNLDIVTEEINASVGTPSYADAYAQFRYQVSTATELDVGMIAYDDDIRLRDFDEDGEIAASRYRNLYGWVQLHHQWHPDLTGSTLLYAGSIAHDRSGFLVDEDLDNGRAQVDDRRRFNLLTLGQQLNYTLSPSMHLEMGARFTRQRGRYDYAGDLQRGLLAELLQTQIDEVRAFRLRPRGHSASAYLSLRAEPLPRLNLEGGLRWDRQRYGLGANDSQLSPRFSARYKLNQRSELRISAGRFFQPEGIHELQIGDGQTRYQKVQSADHFIVSWYQQLGSGFSVRAEAFQKKVTDPKRRFENLFNPFVLSPELASDRIEISPSRARAKGWEVTFKYDTRSRTSAWLTYSNSEAEDRLNGQWVPRAWDQRHAVSTGVSYEGEKWQAAATVLWNDGWRTTALPGFVAEDEIPTLQRNKARLRDYLSVDVQISRVWRWPRHTLTAFLEVTNLLSRRNVGGIEYDVEELDDESGYALLPGEEELFPLVPSLGVRWSF